MEEPHLVSPGPGEDWMRYGYTLIGYFAALITSCSSIPQIVRIMRLRKSREVSLVMPVMLTAGITLWIVHGFLIRDIPLILSSFVSLIFSITTIYTIVKYR